MNSLSTKNLINMCLIVDFRGSRENCKKYISSKDRIAKEDITVYKILNYRSETKGKSSYLNFIYEKGYHYYNTNPKFTITMSGGTYSLIYVNQGLHAWRTKSRANRKMRIMSNNCKVVKNDNSKRCKILYWR
jgi:hypothetical protein